MKLGNQKWTITTFQVLSFSREITRYSEITLNSYSLIKGHANNFLELSQFQLTSKGLGQS